MYLRIVATRATPRTDRAEFPSIAWQYDRLGDVADNNSQQYRQTWSGFHHYANHRELNTAVNASTRQHIRLRHRLLTCLTLPRLWNKVLLELRTAGFKQGNHTTMSNPMYSLRLDIRKLPIHACLKMQRSRPLGGQSS
jgi:hypothetical protein